MGGIVNEIGGLLGNSPNGIGYTAQGTNIIQPTTAGQAQTGYGNAQAGLQQQQQLVNALQAQNGIQNQSNVFNQLQGVANGTGPNPAMAQLNQTTGQNVANQAALMAGQRGAGSNVGLLARQAAQQGANTQQQAVGQGATLEAQQQLGALGQLGGLATQQVAQQTGAVNNLNSQTQSEQQQLLNSINAQNQSNVSLQSNLNNANQAMSQANANNSASAVGGLLSGGAGALGSVAGGGGASGALTALAAYKGGKIENPKLKTVSEGDRFNEPLYPSHLKAVGDLYHGESYKQGGKVPGKAPVKGDNPENDIVPAKLSPGEFVLPKTVMESKDPIAAATKMLSEHLKKKGTVDTKDHQDFKDALGRAIKGRKNK